MGKPNKPDHPWKRALTPRKAAEDRQRKAELMKATITKLPPIPTKLVEPKLAKLK